MAKSITRRKFLHRSGLTAAVVAGALQTKPAKAGANEQLRFALIGSGGMGSENARWLIMHGAYCAAIADVDDRQSAQTVSTFPKVGQDAKPDLYRDYRELLERKDIDAVAVGTPDHWHALPTIHACMAGKDVFVQKPISQNVREGRVMVEATRKYNRVVMVGLQQRVGTHFLEAKQFLDTGQLGKIAFVRAWMCQHRNSVGNPPDGPAPAHVDYDRWLGPAPLRAFNPNRFHGSWRHFWDYANGKQADWGVHMLDVVRWYMGVKAPRTISSSGGKWTIDDNFETPDTQTSAFQFEDFLCLWENRNDNAHPMENRFSFSNSHGIAFYGTGGTLVIDRYSWQVFSEGESIKNPPNWTPPKGVDWDLEMFFAHIREFIQCVKDRKKPRPDIEDGHYSTTLCELANIAYRVDRKLVWDADRERIIGDPLANNMLGREARKGYELPTL